ncbi:MAG TPA: hypothetical protein PLQ38_08100, partial [Methanothrix sp.]|nr:hypothetical protein [Methanothrix sp.]
DYRVVIEYFPIISFLVLYRQPGAVLPNLEVTGDQRALLGSSHAFIISYLKAILTDSSMAGARAWQHLGRKTVFWDRA